MLCAIWYHFYKLKNLKNTHGGVTFKPATLLKVALLHGCFSRFFKLYKWYQITQSFTFMENTNYLVQNLSLVN